jgi:hypothetical protein
VGGIPFEYLKIRCNGEQNKKNKFIGIQDESLERNKLSSFM